MENNHRMTVTILGSGTCVPRLDRHACAALIRAGRTNILLDIGPGIIGQLLQQGVHINDIDFILLSHFHVDHCADLAPFIFATKYSGFSRTKPLTLMGGSGIRTLYTKLDDAYGGHLDMSGYDFKIVELEEQGSSMAISNEGLQLSWAKAAHKPESRSFRFDDASGFSCVYSGDTGYCPDLINLAENADVLICESAMPDDQRVAGHCTPSIAGGMAARANVKKIVLTHLYPECDTVDIAGQCSSSFNGDIVIAQDLMTVTGL